MERRIERADLALFAAYFLLPVVTAVGASYGYHFLQQGEQKPEANNRTPVERDIGSFENSFNSDVQLTPTPQP